jgi:hypothetical protein
MEKMIRQTQDWVDIKIAGSHLKIGKSATSEKSKTNIFLSPNTYSKGLSYHQMDNIS